MVIKIHVDDDIHRTKQRTIYHVVLEYCVHLFIIYYMYESKHDL